MTERDQNILNFLREQAREAGEIMLQYYDGGYQVYTKPDWSKVTDVDLKISELVQERCRTFYPDVILFSEESPKSIYHPGRDHFIVDELDGTSNFINKLPAFTHQAAFYDAEKGLHIGLVYYPLDDVMLYAVRGDGVFLEKNGRVATVTPPVLPDYDQLRFAHPARYRGDKYLDLFRYLGVGDGRIVFTSADRTLKLLEGELDVTLFLMRRIPEWDWAGEKVIVEELGFNHSYLDGTPILFGEPPARSNSGYLICPQPYRSQLVAAAKKYLSGVR